MTPPSHAVLAEPHLVIEHLRTAGKSLSYAHHAAGERENERADLNGLVRDLIFGLNTAVDSLMQMIEEGRFGGGEVTDA